MPRPGEDEMRDNTQVLLMVVPHCEYIVWIPAGDVTGMSELSIVSPFAAPLFCAINETWADITDWFFHVIGCKNTVLWLF
jgi:hypothetical protein